MNEVTRQIMADIDAFLVDTGMSATAFGRHAVGDGHLIRDIRSGVDIRSSTIVKIRRFINARGRVPPEGSSAPGASHP